MNTAPAFPTASNQQTIRFNVGDSYSSNDDVAFSHVDFTGVDFNYGVAESAELAESEKSSLHVDPSPLKDGGDRGNDNYKHNPRVYDYSWSSNCEAPLTDAPSMESQPMLPHPFDDQPHERGSLSSIKFLDNVIIELTDFDKEILTIESDRLLPRPDECIADVCDRVALIQNNIQAGKLIKLFNLLDNGRYVDILRSDIALEIFGCGHQK